MVDYFFLVTLFDRRKVVSGINATVCVCVSVSQSVTLKLKYDCTPEAPKGAVIKFHILGILPAKKWGGVGGLLY